MEQVFVNINESGILVQIVMDQVDVLSIILCYVSAENVLTEAMRIVNYMVEKKKDK